ncbi:MAG: MBL fold metallo-hydrolase [Ignavibacteriaceae bacterium]|jgi:glyoxylase-like metal-dependent hydrolase (beta-lactamase superfamily II)|nr:MBL fold metallo-hydrolase [Ignavibacteriaceae bacterium]
MIQIKVFTFNLFAENTIILWDDESLECAVIDPGCSNSDEENKLADFIEKKNLKVKFLINTHCHIDHIMGCEFVKMKYNPKYFIPDLDLPLIENASMQAGTIGIDFSINIRPDEFLSENKKLSLGRFELEFLFTPGHTAGEFCIYIPDIKTCITGDVLFNESIGRTDLWGGNYDTLIQSIQEKLLTLPDDTIIFPGHGESSTIGKEKMFNPFLNHTV